MVQADDLAVMWVLHPDTWSNLSVVELCGCGGGGKVHHAHEFARVSFEEQRLRTGVEYDHGGLLSRYGGKSTSVRFPSALLLRLHAGATATYLLTFAPPSGGFHDGKLVFHIAATNEMVTWDLRGKGSDPIAEGTISMECVVSVVRNAIPHTDSRQA